MLIPTIAHGRKRGCTIFDHEKLDVYKIAFEFVMATGGPVEELTKSGISGKAKLSA